MSYDTARSADADAYAAGGDGSVSSGSVSYNTAQINGNAWNDRQTGSASEACQYSSVVPASQRRPHSVHSSDVQEYGFFSCDFVSF